MGLAVPKIFRVGEIVEKQGVDVGSRVDSVHILFRSRLGGYAQGVHNNAGILAASVSEDEFRIPEETAESARLEAGLHPFPVHVASHLVAVPG